MKHKYRGKKIGSNKWMYVDLMEELVNNDLPFPNEFFEYPLLEGSLNRSTGLFDKNSTEIYEFDVVKSDSLDDISTVEYHNGIGGYTVLFEEIGQHKMLYLYIDSKDITVIGNMIDNPEIFEEWEKL